MRNSVGAVEVSQIMEPCYGGELQDKVCPNVSSLLKIVEFV